MIDIIWKYASFISYNILFFIIFLLIDKQAEIGTEYSWLQAIYKIELGTLVSPNYKNILLCLDMGY